MKITFFILLVCFFFSGVSSVWSKGIDLMALKKQEEERRKKIVKSKLTVTDDNMNTVDTGKKKYGFVQMESETDESSPQETSEPGTENKKENETQKQPDFWKNQLTELETRIATLKEDIEKGQLELNKLWTDFYLKTIPAEQDASKVQIAQLTNQIEQKKLFLVEAEKQVEDLFEKARKAGVPPGWLR